MSTETEPAPRVCRGCGCTDEDGCLVEIGFAFGSAWIVGCSWVERDLCSGCKEPERRVRGPVVDHHAAPARKRACARPIPGDPPRAAS